MRQTISDVMTTPLEPNQSVMAILIPYDHPDPEETPGDYKVIWDRTREDEVNAARKQFSKWRKKGYLAFSVSGPKAEKGEILHEFDPDAQSIIFSPPLRGGR